MLVVALHDLLCLIRSAVLRNQLRDVVRKFCVSVVELLLEILNSAAVAVLLLMPVLFKLRFKAKHEPHLARLVAWAAIPHLCQLSYEDLRFFPLDHDSKRIQEGQYFDCGLAPSGKHFRLVGIFQQCQAVFSFLYLRF